MTVSSAVSPSTMFLNSDAIDQQSSRIRTDSADSAAVKDFIPIPNLDDHINSGFDNDHIENTASDPTQEKPELVSLIAIYQQNELTAIFHSIKSRPLN